mmetsp:Transcript_1269/g.3393  ORF Transcript_1269/g.3393 Transcript_1269/m.3393 type:complete len:214 (-) Transcript_1269:3644-4285(-)
MRALRQAGRRCDAFRWRPFQPRKLDPQARTSDTPQVRASPTGPRRCGPIRRSHPPALRTPLANRHRHPQQVSLERRRWQEKPSAQLGGRGKSVELRESPLPMDCWQQLRHRCDGPHRTKYRRNNSAPQRWPAAQSKRLHDKFPDTEMDPWMDTGNFAKGRERLEKLMTMPRQQRREDVQVDPANECLRRCLAELPLEPWRRTWLQCMPIVALS